MKRNDYPFVDDQGKEALNFQISMTLYGIVAGIFAILLVGIALLALVAVADFILVIVASMKANYGERYRYPFTIRLIQLRRGLGFGRGEKRLSERMERMGRKGWWRRCLLTRRPER